MVDALRTEFIQHADPKNARKMSAYMKGHFPFLGIKSPERKDISASHIREWSKRAGGLNKVLVRDLWSRQEREFQYVALDYLKRTERHWRPEHLEFFEELVVTKPWWDTVDLLASNMIGGLLKSYPELRTEMGNWNKSSDVWKIRSSILYQLKFKEEVDFTQLTRFIIEHADSKEFFLQKASGWALRQYSKFEPEVVKGFISSHRLAPLTLREASKYL